MRNRTVRAQVLLASAAALVFSFGYGGTGTAVAQNLLSNPGAETDAGADECSTTDWTVSDGSVVQGVEQQNQSSGTVLPRTDDCLFTMAGAATADGGSPPTEFIHQDADIAGCSIFGLGTWEASGWIQTEATDFGGLNINFFDDGDNAVGPTFSLGNLTFPQTGGNTYDDFSLDGNIPDGVVTANYEVTGSLDDGTFINVFYDDLSFEVDCVTDAAKISGGKERGQGKGGGNDPLYAFSGAVGNLDETDNVGTIEINYRDPSFGPTTCTFTPTDITYTDPAAATIVATYECVGGGKDGDDGDATIKLTAKDQGGAFGCGGGNFRGRNADRGSVAVDADDDDLDIGDLDGFSGEENCLETGNVEIVPPPA